MKNTPSTTPSDNKPQSTRDQVIARLKAVQCWPVPAAVVDRLTNKVNAKMATVVNDSIKGFGSVAAAMSEIEKVPATTAASGA